MTSGDNALNGKLEKLHQQIREYFPFVKRVSVALYDPATEEIKTFLYSPVDSSPLSHYAVKLATATWLHDLRKSRRARVIDDMSASLLGEQFHSRRIISGGYRASYTVPVYDAAEFLGFIFFNATAPHVFTERVTRQLDLFVRIISLMIESDQRTVSILTGGLLFLRELSRFRDEESTSHLSRMSYYSELIARELAPQIGRDDDWVQHMRLFAPLHDIGKITTPDAILFKPGKLTPSEFDVMKRHAVRGAEILVTLIDHLSLENVPHIDALLHVARSHHERWDGNGYPDGLAGEGIAPEARIVKVADVFDALTSKRCYKEAWPVERAESYLREGAGTDFDPACVHALLQQHDKVLAIMARFADESSEVS